MLKSHDIRSVYVLYAHKHIRIYTRIRSNAMFVAVLLFNFITHYKNNFAFFSAQKYAGKTQK